MVVAIPVYAHIFIIQAVGCHLALATTVQPVCAIKYLICHLDIWYLLVLYPFVLQALGAESTLRSPGAKSPPDDLLRFGIFPLEGRDRGQKAESLWRKTLYIHLQA